MEIEDIKKLSIVLEIADKIISSTILLTLIANNDISNLLWHVNCLQIVTLKL